MPSIEVKDAHVDIPVFTSRSRGLINSIFRYAQRERSRIEALGLHSLQVHALRGVSLSIRDGDRVGLLGRNGAGKTTLLRVLSGAYEPSRGSVCVEGSVSSLTDLSLGLDMEASGYENLELRALYLGMGAQERGLLIKDAEDFSELGDHLYLPVRAYSAGMVLRLAFAMSTYVAPDILLMDEMVGAGDAHFVGKAHARMESLMNRASVLVLASHNEQIVRSFCRRGICLSGGAIAFEGSIDDCLKFYSASAGQLSA